MNREELAAYLTDTYSAEDEKNRFLVDMSYELTKR